MNVVNILLTIIAILTGTVIGVALHNFLVRFYLKYEKTKLLSGIISDRRHNDRRSSLRRKVDQVKDFFSV